MSRQPSLRWAGLVLGAAVLAAGCSQAGGSAASPTTTEQPATSTTEAALSTTTTTAPETTTTTEPQPEVRTEKVGRSTITMTIAADTPPEHLAVLDAYWNYRVALTRLGDAPDPSDTEWRELVTGEVLETSLAMLDAMQRSGQYAFGSSDLKPRVMELAEDTATVEDCIFGQVVGYASDGSITIPADEVPMKRWTIMRLIGGAWRADTAWNTQEPCA